MVHEIARRVRVMGRVQGVAYRAWTQAVAKQHSLRGWVRNQDDGSVEAMLVGDEDAVVRMLLAMRSGPGAASVRDIEVIECTETPEVSEFKITG